MADAWGGIPIVTGRAVCLGLEAAAALLLGGPDRTGLAAEIAEHLSPGDILVAWSLGGGCDDDRLPRALLAAGLSAIVAGQLDSELEQRAAAVGLRAATIHEALSIRPGALLRVDFEASRVVNMTASDRYPIRNLDDTRLGLYRRLLGESS